MLSYKTCTVIMGSRNLMLCCRDGIFFIELHNHIRLQWCNISSVLPFLSSLITNLNFSFQARRFITLIDELYNHHCCLFCSAASSIDDLFQGTEEGTPFDLERQFFFSFYQYFQHMRCMCINKSDIKMLKLILRQ